MLKAYLSTQASSLSAFVISKTHISGQKPCERQLNAKVCGSKSVVSQARLSCEEERVWSNSHHHLVSNTPTTHQEISGEWDAWLPWPEIGGHFRFNNLDGT